MRLNPRTGILVLSLMVAFAPSLSAQHLYLGNNNTPGGIRQYSLPLTPGSAPNFTIALNNVLSMDVDVNGNIVAGDFGDTLSYYPAPVSGSSTRTAAFNIGAGNGAYQISFLPNGDFWIACSNKVNRFNRPFTNNSTPAQTITVPGFNTLGVAVDAAQNVYATNGSSNNNILVYAPPYTGQPIATAQVNGQFRNLALSATQLFVAVVGPGTGRIDVYNLPLVTGSTPAFSITAGLNGPEAVDLDSIGNLYAGNIQAANITMYRPPFSASSTPAVTVAAPGVAIFAMAVEKPGLAVLPAVASAAGAFGSFFRTGVQLSNPGAAAMSGRIVFHAAGTSGLETDPSVSYSLNPGQTQNIADVVQSIGQSGLGSADVLAVAGGFPTVVTRVFNDAGSSGTAGFTEDLVPVEHALAPGDQFTLIVPADLTKYRYNVGVRSLAAGAAITVKQRNSAGTLLKTLTKTYTPNFFEQVGVAAFLSGATVSANDSITVSVDAGSLFVYGASTDNTTQDPSIQLGRK